ncbi:hypothetical protein ACIQYL_15535 [Lysinibacillus xylanilyticus]|uniref:hypothetical protein n=1 Tax=Lysinibacillus xylanilyticus TaxID=582475 RepID=UPI0038064C8A
MMNYPSFGGLSVVAALPSVGFCSPSVASAVLSVVVAFLSVAWPAFRRCCISFRRLAGFPSLLYFFPSLGGYPSLLLFFPSLGGYPSLLLFFPSLLLFFPSLVALSVTSALLLSATIISNKPSYKIKKL